MKPKKKRRKGFLHRIGRTVRLLAAGSLILSVLLNLICLAGSRAVPSAKDKTKDC